jgi:hypothetical protein
VTSEQIRATDARIVGKMVEDGRLTPAQVEEAMSSLPNLDFECRYSRVQQPVFGAPAPVMPRPIRISGKLRRGKGQFAFSGKLRPLAAPSVR